MIPSANQCGWSSRYTQGEAASGPRRYRGGNLLQRADLSGITRGWRRQVSRCISQASATFVRAWPARYCNRLDLPVAFIRDRPAPDIQVNWLSLRCTL